ncbi:integrase_H2C2 domain-containing protein [Trichonephila clavipes]|nr:integrase_H2C2 domain-containing protein [Trichonephila clavipes]
MYKNALKEDLIRVVEELDGIVESTDTIVKLKTKIENSSTFESDPDFVKTLIQNCIDERVSQNERENAAFLTKKINDEYKSEILINLLGERAHNVLLYIKEEELNDYEKLKSIVLREFQLTPRECLNSFKNAVKSSGETYIQFAARLTANFQYYCSLRKVNSFESLCDLIISDKLYETLNKETATHIGIREAEDWFRPIDLAKEFSSGLHGNTAADSVRSEWPLWHAAKKAKHKSSRAGAAKHELKLCEIVEEKQKLLDIREKEERERCARAGVTF